MNSKLDKLIGNGTGMTRYGNQYVISGNLDLLKAHIRQAVFEGFTNGAINRPEAKAAIQAHINTIATEAEIKGIMYCYSMGGVTPEQQRYMEARLYELRPLEPQQHLNKEKQ